MASLVFYDNSPLEFIAYYSGTSEGVKTHSKEEFAETVSFVPSKKRSECTISIPGPVSAKDFAHVEEAASSFKIVAGMSFRQKPTRLRPEIGTLSANRIVNRAHSFMSLFASPM